MNHAFAFTSISLALSLSASAEIVYQQSPNADDQQVGLGWYSSSEPRPTRNFRHADNFKLNESAQIAQIEFFGLTEGLSHTDLSNFDSFTIELWTSQTLPNTRIKPNTLIATESFTLQQTNAMQTGRSAISGAFEYQHLVELTNPVALDADTNYWISISARSIDPSADVWQWQDSDLFDSVSSSWSYADNRWLYQEDSDSAFTLIAIPTPNTMMCALISIGLTTRRRR